MPVSLFDRKGIFDVLKKLESGEKRFVELKTSLERVSSVTILKRLREAEELGVVSRTSSLNGGRAYLKYKLTEDGMELIKDFEEVLKDLNDIQTRKNTLRKKWERKLKE